MSIIVWVGRSWGGSWYSEREKEEAVKEGDGRWDLPRIWRISGSEGTSGMEKRAGSKSRARRVMVLCLLFIFSSGCGSA